jgi:hypothetical protein
MNRIKLKPDTEKLELLQAMGSRNRIESLEAQEIFAALAGPVVQQVLDQSATSALVYEDREYDINSGDTTIPLDLYDGNSEGLIDIWSQTMAGGLATNLIHGMDEFRLTTYQLNSAVSFLKRYAQHGRLDVVSKGLQRMAQELLVKTERHAWSPILAALAAARTNNVQHLIDATTTNVFQVDDMNRLWTKAKRLRRSWINGTPTSVPARGLTDLIMSPEMIEQIRSFAYNPMNTRGVPDSVEATALGLPDAVRQRFFDSADIPEIFGLGIIELQELGVAGAYTVLFDQYYTAGGGDVGFDSAADDLILGVDLSVEGFVRVVARDSDIGSTVSVQVDDQFVSRQQKIGWFSEIEEGRAVIDNKCVLGIVV